MASLTASTMVGPAQFDGSGLTEDEHCSSSISSQDGFGRGGVVGVVGVLGAARISTF